MSTGVLQARSRLSDGIAAGPEIALAATCLVSIFAADFGKRFIPRLRDTIGIEFLVIHAFVFLGALALMRPKRAWSRVLRVVAFISVCALYSFFAALSGTDALVSFWLLTVSTYLGFFIHDVAQDGRRVLICRWVVDTVTYIAWFLFCGMLYEVFDVSPPTPAFLFGFLFFGTLAYFDFTRFYERFATPVVNFLRSR